MLINQLSFAEFYDSIRQRPKYTVLITLVARAADARQQYREILENWSSFHDLTGDHVAFVFAGQPVNETSTLGWRHRGQINKIPMGIYVPKPADLDLEDFPGDMPYIVSPEAPEPEDLYKNHTGRTREIKAA